MKIISGGQTGVDRSALQWGLDHGFEVGGWCPKGRRAEDGKVPAVFPLKETPSRNYLVRTEKNVREADATLLFVRDDVPSPGSFMTIRYCQTYFKPCLRVGVTHDPQRDAEAIAAFLDRHQPAVLNVAGHRESSCPGIAAYAYQVLTIAQHLTPLLKAPAEVPSSKTQGP